MSTDFPGGFPGGLTVQGTPINIMHSGNIYWVDDSGSNGNDGTFNRPWATLDYAVSQCTANQGDIIVIKAGHAENVANATDCNISTAGISIIGLGVGNNRPTFTSITTETAVVSVDAANVSIKNVRFVCGIDAQTKMLDINATTNLDGCEIEGSSSAQPVLMVDIGGTASSSNGTVVQNCTFRSITAGAVKGIWVSSAQKDVTIENNDFIGDFSSACVGEAITISNTNFTIKKNRVHNSNAASQGLVMFSATGMFVDNHVYNKGGVATAVAGGSMAFHENYATSALGVAALLVKNGAFS